MSDPLYAHLITVQVLLVNYLRADQADEYVSYELKGNGYFHRYCTSPPISAPLKAEKRNRRVEMEDTARVAKEEWPPAGAELVSRNPNPH